MKSDAVTSVKGFSPREDNEGEEGGGGEDELDENFRDHLPTWLHLRSNQLNILDIYTSI